MTRLYELFRDRLADLLRIPIHPHPPLGLPSSLRQFRAAAAYLRLRLALWWLRQAVIFAGFLVGVILAHRLLPESSPVRFKDGKDLKEIRIPIHRILWFAEPAALLLALFQAPLSWMVIRLEYEFRCYMVTDRSLRIRDGLATIRETTLSFANVQQISVEQGPLQRFLGLADVVVSSAGGGASAIGAKGKPGESESAHTARFRDVDNADEIRSLIVGRLRSMKDAGLGDSDDHHVAATSTASPLLPARDALDAARSVLAECHSLRRLLTAQDSDN